MGLYCHSNMILILREEVKSAESDSEQSQVIMGSDTENCTVEDVLGCGDGCILHETVQVKPRMVTAGGINQMVTDGCKRSMGRTFSDVLGKLEGDVNQTVPVLKRCAREDRD